MLTECNFYFSIKVRGWIAQSVEQRPEKPCVVGSIPTLATMWHRCLSSFGKFFSEGYFSGREQDARDGVSKIRFFCSDTVVLPFFEEEFSLCGSDFLREARLTVHAFASIKQGRIHLSFGFFLFRSTWVHASRFRCSFCDF